MSSSSSAMFAATPALPFSGERQRAALATRDVPPSPSRSSPHRPCSRGSVTQVQRVRHGPDALACNVVHGLHSPSVSDGRSGPRPRPRRPRKRNTTPVAGDADASTGPRGRPSGDAAGSPQRRRFADASPLAAGIGCAEAVAPVPQAHRAELSRSCSARRSLCRILTLHSTAPRNTPQASTLPSRLPMPMRGTKMCMARR